MRMKRLTLSKEQKDQAIADIKEFFLSERDEEIGDLAAILLLDFFTEKLASTYYNLGIADAKAMLSEKLDDLHGLEIWRLRKE